jgi:hypothetical protein
VQSLAISLETGSACNYTSTQLGVRVAVYNDGNANAGPFQVSVNGTPRPVAAGLPAGQTTAVWAGGYVSGPSLNSGAADSAQQVAESDETNNTLSQVLPIPTLPPTCTPPPPPLQRVFLPLIRR